MDNSRKPNTALVLTAIVAVLAMGFALLWLLGVGKARPTASDLLAAESCNAEDLVDFADKAVAVNVNNTDGTFIVYATLKADSFNDACANKPVLFVYTSGSESASSGVTLKAQKQGNVITQLEASERSTVEQLFGSSAQVSSITVRAYVLENIVDKDLSSSKLIGSKTFTPIPAGGGGGGTGNPTPGGGTTPGGGGQPTSPSELCQSDKFEYDAKTGLCLPKITGSGPLTGQKDIFGLANAVIKSMLILAFVVAIIFLIVGGFQFITSSGNEEQAAKGRRTIMYALIGIVVVIMSYALVSVVTNLVSSGV